MNQHRSELKTAVLALLAILALASIGCKGPDGSPLPIAPDQVAPITEPIDDNESPEPLTYRKNWGSISPLMPIDFSGLQIGAQTIRRFYQYQDGRIAADISVYPLDPTYIRRCLDRIIVEGTETEGTVTVSRSEAVWQADPDEDDSRCHLNDGVYNFRVTADGLLFGRGDSLVLYQEARL